MGRTVKYLVLIGLLPRIPRSVECKVQEGEGEGEGEKKQINSSSSENLTCNGVLSDESAVNPTMSLKNTVTSSKFSASTGRPLFN